jgi:putative SOS response-associated peptidase YedK
VVRTFAIITCEANEKLRALHDRMPVILPRAAWPAWLGEEPAEAPELLALLRPYPSAALAAWPVPRRVGRVAEDDPGLAGRARSNGGGGGGAGRPAAVIRRRTGARDPT